MKKRNSKKKKALDSNSSTQGNSKSFQDDVSFASDQTFSDVEGCSCYCRVQLGELMKDGCKNLKWIKDNYKNIVLLHPSILQSFSTSKFIFIKGKNNSSLCVAYPLKSIKQSDIVFPKDNLGFVQNENVMIYAYTKNMCEAVDVTVTLNSEMTVSDELKQCIAGKLSKQLICSGMKLRLNFSESDFDCVISKVSGKEIMSNSYFNVSCYEDSCTDVCNISNISAENSADCFHSESFIQDNINVKKTTLSSMFSSMSLIESNLPVPEEPLTENRESNFDVSEIPTYYTLSFHSNILFEKDFGDKDENKMFPRFSHIGGLKEPLKLIKAFINLIFNSNDSNPGVLVLVGPTGTGKSFTLKAICNEYAVPVIEIPWHSIYSRSLSDAQREMKLIFQKAQSSTPSIILIDELNYLCPLEKDTQTLHITKILTDLIETCDGKILILAATNNSEYDDTIFKTQKGMTEIVKFPTPSSTDRHAILKLLLSRTSHNLSDDDIEQCVSHSQGCTGSDLADVIKDASTFACVENVENEFETKYLKDSVLTLHDIEEALKFKKNTIASSNIKVQKVYWNDIGGMGHIKAKLKEVIEWPLKYPEKYKQFNVTPSRGILLYGPPGCSKTMIAKALATECEFNFLSRNASDLFNKYVGESERAVRHLFAEARAKSPCIIFLDEIDALVAERGSDSGGSGVGDRIVTSLLTEIDGIEELHGVLIIAATNRPDMLDDALMRNGRIDNFIYVSLPDTEARKEILRIQMKNRTVDDAVDLKYLSLKTEGYTGAEIVNVCNEAAFQLLSENPKCESPIFSTRHFETALQTIVPRTTKEMLNFYENFNSNYFKK